MSAHGPGIASDFDESELEKVFDRHLMRRLGRYLLPYKWYVGLAILLAIASAMFRIIGPRISAFMVDSYIPATTPRMQRNLAIFSFLYLGLLILVFVCNFALSYLTAWVGQRGMYDLRRDIFEKLHRLSLRFFDRTPSGRLLTRTTSDVDVLNELFADGVVYIFTDVVLLVGILISWFWIDWRLGLLLLFVGPLLAIASYNFRIKARAAYRAGRLRIAALNAFLQENLAGIRTVQAFNREKANCGKYERLNASYRDSQLDTVKQYALFFPLVSFISNLAILTVLAYGAWALANAQVFGGEPLTPGKFLLYFQYIGWFFMPIQDLTERYNIFQAAMASSERIFQLLDEHEDIQDPGRPATLTEIRHGLEMHHVWFAYKSEDWVLRDVSLEVEKGKRVALVGATGAGKSTIINLACRFYDVQKGEILLDGINIKEYAQDEFRRRMAIVLQDVFLFSGTIAENIRLGNKNISDEQVIQAAKYVNADRFITRLPNGYANEVLERGATLSTGQKQLLAFARAVAFNPDILILDEATANIDTETEALIQDALYKLMQGRTCIIVAHRLSTIQNVDKIIVFHHGRIHEEGTHQELLARNGLYRNLYMLQYQI